MPVIRTLLVSDCYASDNRASVLIVMPVKSALLGLIFTPVTSGPLVLIVTAVISALLGLIVTAMTSGHLLLIHYASDRR